jgi:phosphatidylinositol alpha-mannosyltransferase
MPSPSRLRICHATAAYYPYPSGVSEYVHNLAQAQLARGHHVHILTTGYGERRTTNDERRTLDARRSTLGDLPVTRFGRAYLIPMNKSFATVPFGWHLSGDVKRFLAAHPFDILHLHGTYPPDIAFWALRHSRTTNVVTFHTVGFATSRIAAWLCRRAFAPYNRKLDGRIVESKSALRFSEPYFPGDYRIIRGAIDSRRFNPALAPVPGLPPAGSRILFVGRLDARKGLSVLIRALPLIRRRLPGVQLIVVGKGPLDAEVRSLCAKLQVADCVVFQGFVANEMLPRYYVSADVYCAPTLGGEAFGFVLIEAMASGIPVVASRITGYDEVIQDGETGILCPPNDPGALAESLIRVLTDAALRRRLKTSGRARAELHDWSLVAAEIEEYYQDAQKRKLERLTS